MSNTDSVLKTPLYQSHVDLGAKMVDFAGYSMPVQYSSAIEEHFAVRDKAGLFDVSHMGQFHVSGKDARKFLQWITSNDVEKLHPGKAQYTCLPRPEGGIVDDMVLYQLDEENYLAVVNAANLQKDWTWFQENSKSFEVELENQSDQWSLIALQGPLAETILKSLLPNLGDIPFYSFEFSSDLADNKVIISATGYTGSGGYELYTPNENAVQIWNKLLEAGKDQGLIPCGLAARDTLRLEKGYMLYGNDITDDTSTLEAGLGWITKLKTDFVGKEFLAKQKEEGLTRKLVALQMTGRGIPRKDYPILDKSGNEIGNVTSGTQSPKLKKGIALGYVSIENAKVGQTLQVDCRGKVFEAEIIKAPFV